MVFAERLAVKGVLVHIAADILRGEEGVQLICVLDGPFPSLGAEPGKIHAYVLCAPPSVEFEVLTATVTCAIEVAAI
jgi:hypothetical protein